MSIFDLEKSWARARARLGAEPPRSRRAPRSDRGVSRLSPEVGACIAKFLSGQERPRMRDLLSRIGACCREKGRCPPARATVYKWMATSPCPTFRVSDLPASPRAALYNLASESEVPAHQVAFYCFNYGDLKAVSFAAGLPWLALYQARLLPGYRRKSRGLLDAVAHVRNI